jgi:hypothetical protein
MLSFHNKNHDIVISRWLIMQISYNIKNYNLTMGNGYFTPGLKRLEPDAHPPPT